jgi:cytohesin
MKWFFNRFKKKFDLYNLISHRKLKELESALKSGSNPNLPDTYGQSPIFRVVYNPGRHQSKMLTLLLKYGADVNYRKARDGETVIHNAASVEIAEILLKHGADITAKANNNSTPLHKTTSAQMAQFFIDHGLDVNAKDNSGATPLFNAVYFGLELVNCLLANGATAEIKNNRGLTPLMCVAGTEYANENDTIELKKICDSLLKYGAKPDSKDNKGKTAAQHALEYQNKELAKYLDRKTRKHNKE